MLVQLRSRSYAIYRSLPILGHIVDEFTEWCHHCGYSVATIRCQLTDILFLAGFFRKRGVKCVEELKPEHFETAWKRIRSKAPRRAGTVWQLQRFLQQVHGLKQEAFRPATRVGSELDRYGEYLRRVRGLSTRTVAGYGSWLRAFLKFIRYERSASALTSLEPQKIEAFLRLQAKACKRSSLQSLVSCLRGFLRFQHTEGVLSRPLHAEIDTARVYRLEQLPKSLPWPQVQKLLRSVDCHDPNGLRDFTMLYLMAAYGLRRGELVALTLDHIDWRARVLRVPQSKTRQCLSLPLTDEAGDILHRYLKEGRPLSQRRELFLRSRAPVEALTPQAVYDVMNSQFRRIGLGIRFQGTHVLRHSFAVRLLRQGVPMKTIGDMLGHHHITSTAVYLRLAIDDLRIAAAPVPKNAPASALLKPGWQRCFPRIQLRTGPRPHPPSHFRSGLGASIQCYLATKQALGRGYVRETMVLLDWDAFLYRNQRCSKTVTAVAFHKWANSLAHLMPTVGRARMRIVRNFLLFHARDQSVGFIPDMATFPKASPPRPPRLVSEDEMARVLATTGRLLPSENGSPLRAETIRIALLLLFCCGLRRGEVLRLRLAHFDQTENLLRIENTKFFKSRLVPLSSSVCRELVDYLELRRQRHLPMEVDSFLIWSHRRPEPHAVYTASGLLRTWRHLCLTVGVLDQRGRPPRLHDLRHHSERRIIPSGAS